MSSEHPCSSGDVGLRVHTAGEASASPLLSGGDRGPELDGVRRDADKGNRRPDGVRFGAESTPGLVPDTARAYPSVVHQDAAPSGGDLSVTGGWAAPAQANLSLCGGDPVAEISFPAIVAEVDQLELPRADPTRGDAAQVVVVLDLWPVGNHAEVARRLVSSWRSLSRRLVAKQYHRVRLKLPLVAGCFTTPGLFGCPAAFGDQGDDHWRISVGPSINLAGQRATLELVRSGRGGEGRRRQEVRHGGTHVLVVARRFHRGHRAAAIGISRGHDGARTAISVVESRTRANPTTAVAEAAAEALDQVDCGLDVTIWTQDDLVRAAVRGHYVRARGGIGAAYRGARPPEMNAALDALRVAVRTRTGKTRLKAVSKGGAIAEEIVGIAKAIEAVRSIPERELADEDAAVLASAGPRASSRRRSGLGCGDAGPAGQDDLSEAAERTDERLGVHADADHD